MPTPRAIAAPVLHKLRDSRYRQPILRRLLRADNWLRRWITFFSFERGTHPKHRLTRYHNFFLDRIEPDQTVIDVGAGLGLLAADVADKARRVVGIDIDKPSVAKSRQRHQQQPNLTFLYGDATTYSFDEQFDVLLLSNVLEHIEDRVAFLQKLSRVAPRLLIRVPMIDRDWVVLLKKELGVEWRLDPTHYTEYTEVAFRHDVADAGLEIRELQIRFGELYAVVERTASRRLDPVDVQERESIR